MKPSPLPPLLATSIDPQHLDLRDNAPSLILCPGCDTWRHLKRRMIRPHRPDGTTRCSNSARLVTLDITIEQWQAKLAKTKLNDEGVDTGSRHGTRVKRQRTEPAPAVSQLVPAPPTAETTRQAYADHRAACMACTGRKNCTDGERLAYTYAQRLRQEPRLRQVQARQDQQQRTVDRRRALQQPVRRASEWAAVRHAVKRADEQRTPSGPTVSDYRGPGLPLKTPA